MSSRSKKKLENAEQIIGEFLERNNNNPQEAWDSYIAHYLRNRIPFPNNIKGIKDFVRLSKKIEILK